MACSTVFRGAANADANADLMRSAPPSDVVVTVDAATLLNKTLPSWLADKPETLKRFNDNIARVHSDTGVDLRQVDRILLAAASGANAQTSFVLLAEGNFLALTQPAGAARLVDAFKATYPKFDVRTESYGDATLYVMPEKAAPEAKPDLSMAILDGRTFAFGTPDAVRGVIDARKSKAPNATANPALAEAYNQTTEGSAVRFAALVPKPMLDAMVQDDPGNPFLKSLKGIRYVFGQSDLSTANGWTLKLTARAGSPEQGRSVKLTLDAAVGFAASFTENRPQLATLLAYITTASAGSDAMLTVAVPSEKLPEVFKLLENRPT